MNSLIKKYLKKSSFHIKCPLKTHWHNLKNEVIKCKKIWVAQAYKNSV